MVSADSIPLSSFTTDIWALVDQVEKEMEIPVLDKKGDQQVKTLESLIIELSKLFYTKTSYFHLNKFKETHELHHLLEFEKETKVWTDTSDVYYYIPHKIQQVKNKLNDMERVKRIPPIGCKIN